MLETARTAIFLVVPPKVTPSFLTQFLSSHPSPFSLCQPSISASSCSLLSAASIVWLPHNLPAPPFFHCLKSQKALYITLWKNKGSSCYTLHTIHTCSSISMHAHTHAQKIPFIPAPCVFHYPGLGFNFFLTFSSASILLFSISPSLSVSVSPSILSRTRSLHGKSLPPPILLFLTMPAPWWDFKLRLKMLQ